MRYELVTGLETHIELSTNTKIFCGCTTEFGGDPNTHCCPVCCGFPGTLPKLNRSVVAYGVMAAIATNCKINQDSKMERKNYFYPDLPKAYQNSQLQKPLGYDGYITLSSGKKIRIHQIHIEEDAGKLVHVKGEVYSDCNRGGVPLIEVVTEPDFRSVAEVREYLEKLQTIMRYIDISDCKMQEGSMRCDVNMSVRPFGQEKFGTRTEIKNMNSFSFIEKAMNYEYERQVDIIESGGEVIQQTLRFSEETGETSGMRNKEDAHDYRYFRDPDLVRILVSDEQLEELKSRIPELPDARFSRYVDEFGLSEADAASIIKFRRIADFFDSAAEKIKTPKSAANYILTQIFRRFDTEDDREKWDVGFPAHYLAALISLIEQGKINNNIAKRTLETMLDTKKAPSEILTPEELEGLSSADLSAIIEKVISAQPAAVADYKAGKEKALKSLLGGVMRETKGKANPQETEQLLISKLSD